MHGWIYEGWILVVEEMCGIGCEMENGDFFDDVGVILLVNGDKVILLIFLVYSKPLESISVYLVVRSWKLVFK